MEFVDLTGGAFMADAFLTTTECEVFIAVTEELGFEPAPVSTAAGAVMMPDVRNNERVMFDDDELAATLFSRLLPMIPERWRTVRLGDRDWSAVGLNERFRFYRYDPGQSFAMHRDGCHERENGERSLLTMLVYLNAPEAGGATEIYAPEDVLSVDAIAGRVLLFAHRLLHEGAPVVAGRKYVLRTDVMHRPRAI